MNQITPNRIPTELACLRLGDLKISPLGRVVADILAVVFGGLHHLDQRELMKVHWDEEHIMAINFQRANSWGSTDFNELTQLVVLAHDANVRIAISSPGMKVLRLTFQVRYPHGSSTERQGTLEEAAAEIRKTYTVGAPAGD